MYWHVGDKKCCRDCFQHPYLRDYVSENSTATGTCDYCNSSDVPLVFVGELTHLFKNVYSIYTPAETFDVGDFLIELIQEDWKIFPDAFAASGSADQLMEDIDMAGWDDDSGEPPLAVLDLFRRLAGHPLLGDPDSLDDVLDIIGRLESQDKVYREILGEDWRSVAVRLREGSVLYRARPGFVDDSHNGTRSPWTGAGIGPNPEGPPGRGNRKGKVVLYVAEEERTAIAEVRPARGHLVSVAELQLTDAVEILDLVSALPNLNPFDSERLHYEIQVEKALAWFATELSEPLLRQYGPDEDPVEYHPTQRLCEYFEGLGFDGIRYPSAMSPEGSNIVLFRTVIYREVKAKLVQVQQIELKYRDYFYLGAKV